MKNKLKACANYFLFIWQFALDDFKTKYAGSLLGGLWAFLQPVITIVLYWFVFQLGFRSRPVENFPFILWLIVGLIPWFFISEGIVNATACLADYSYLVKKVVFPIQILPLAKMLSVLFVQLVLLVIEVGCLAIAGFYPALCYLQSILFVLYMILLVTAVSYITATLYVFFRDTIQIVSIFMQIFFWITPIVYSIESMPETVQKIMIFNPVYYVIHGFRDILVGRTWSVTETPMLAYYWGIVLIMLAIGLGLFNRCKDHFADVL